MPRLRSSFLLLGAAVASTLIAVPTALAATSSSPPATAASSLPRVRAVPVPDPTISGPVVTNPDLDGTHGIPYTASAVDLPSHGYTEQEYFVSGQARSYAPVGPLTTDGRWNVSVAGSAAYKTRIIVRKPVDMRTFDGTVVVEWLNATVGRDLDVGWVFGSTGMLNDHDIYVGVSAQALPIDGAAQGLKTWDPARYGSLVHPGDQYSYDIFAQVAQALRHPRGVDPIAGARPRTVLAYGDSQSASRLTTYADALQNRDQVFDGLLINSRSAAGAALNTDTSTAPPAGTQIRTDLSAKVLTLETEFDVVRANNAGYLPARQPDSSIFRDWEVAGSSHFDAAEEATMRIQAFRESPFASPPIQYNVCAAPMNNLRFSDTVDTAFHDLAKWTESRSFSPPQPPVLATTADGTAYLKNALGLTEGGIQPPQVTVPTGVVNGVPSTTTGTCNLAGSYTEFSADQLRSLYPTHQSYVAEYAAAVARSVRDGYLQPYDAETSIAQARNSSIPAVTNVP